MRNLILRILHEHISEQRKFWTYDEVKDIAKKYDNLKDFREKDNSAFQWAKRNHVFSELTSHMTKQYLSKSKDEIENLVKNYTTVADFIKDYPNEYRQAIQKGWSELFNELTPSKIKWTLQKVLELAKKYKTMEDFRNNEIKAYWTLKKRPEWKEEVWKLYKPQQVSWTYDLAKSIADKYDNLFDFIKSEPKAIAAIRRLNWLDLLSHMNRKYTSKTGVQKPKKLWTDDEIRQEAQKYDSVSDFRKYSKNAMDAAINHGIYDEVSAHMKRVGTKWTKQMVWDEALKYQTRSEFMNGNYAAYQAAHSKGWWDDVTSHMVRLGNLHNRLVYVYEFPDNSVYVGLTMNKQDRNLRHRTKEKSAVYQHIKKTNLEPIMKVVSDDYIDAEDARNLEHCTIQKYKNDGWNVLNKAEAGGLGGRCIKMYTKEQAQQEALKYQTPTQFMEKSSSIYRQAKKNGWLPEITQHMIKKTKWTKDMIIDKMSQHKSMNDFRKNDFNSWAAAYRILGNQFIKDYYTSK